MLTGIYHYYLLTLYWHVLCGLRLPYFYIPLLFINFKCLMLNGMFYVDWDFHIFNIITIYQL